MNNYETVFILTPDLSAEQTKETVDKFISMITDNGGELVNREEWGMRKLAYPIQAKSTGYYVFVEFKSEPSFIATLEVNYRRDDKVMRFLTFRQDKFAHEYAEKRRRNRKEVKATPEAADTTTEEENN
ncbi:MAG: 30S ribosomal protein S6 [Bacteroidales bacterium]|uniref:30S ribosomal protein S6 n=1 Tax=Porphyromonas sp. TaxID=1924944 RepID=UPI002971343C|nr:30S ribosomal protein S6 [Porphyromonas sp.]MDD7438560.1 30S ribosomal protein S6 [Bacteroidales bacterium]MDY3067965.1 30S ribosomal protein S6 [Porphyromonas sp.]